MCGKKTTKMSKAVFLLNSNPKYNDKNVPLEIIIIIPNIDNKHKTKYSPLNKPIYSIYFLEYIKMIKATITTTLFKSTA